MKPKKGIRQAVESKPSAPRKSPANKPAVTSGMSSNRRSPMGEASNRQKYGFTAFLSVAIAREAYARRPRSHQGNPPRFLETRATEGIQ